MKIGLLTVPFNNNYGGLLQAYALKSVLTEMGHEVVIVNRRRNLHTGLKHRVYRLIVRLHLIKDFIKVRTERLSVNTDLFISKYLTPMTDPYFSSTEIRKCLKYNFDAFVVGSDQVWRYLYAKDSIGDYFFSFLRGTNIPRFSYAASFGTDMMDYPDEKRDEVALLLKDFIGVSVREKSGKKLLVNHFAVEPEKIHVVLDPTLLLSVDYYKRLDHKEKLDSPYLFTYILDESDTSTVAIGKIINKTGLHRRDMKAQTGVISKLEVIEPVEKWLSAISDAEFVITDSFHGTVFSIIFNRPFLVIANSKRGIARLVDLLSRFNLLDRLVENLNDLRAELLDDQIDWSSVNEKRQTLKEESLQYLQEVFAVMLK